MPALVLCYSPADEAAVRRLGEFLVANLAIEVSYDEGRVGPGFDLVDAADRALSAEMGLVFLSRDSVPTKWLRDRWEPVFFGPAEEVRLSLGFVLLNECSFPKLLRRARFFDLSADFMSSSRAIKHWLLRPDAPGTRPAISHDPLREQIADIPGLACDVEPSKALAFAASCQRDFEAVYTFDLHKRNRAGMLGDIGHALGLTLPGTVEQNRADLCRIARDRRYLVVFRNVPELDRDFLSFGGRLSTVFTTVEPHPESSRDSIEATWFALPRDEAACFSGLGQAHTLMSSLFDSDFIAGLRLGWAMVSLLKSAHRIAEVRETLTSMQHAAAESGDLDALAKIEWEQSWFEGDPSLLGMPAPETTQLTFAFA